MKDERQLTQRNKAKYFKRGGTEQEIGLLTTFASLSLVLSLCTIYLSNLRQFDDLRVLIDSDGHRIFLDKDNSNGFAEWGRWQLTLINAVNRSVALLNVGLSVCSAGREDADCPLRIETVYGCAFEPLVIKAGEVLLKNVERNAAVLWEPRQGGWGYVSHFPSAAEGEFIIVGITFSIVTPDNYTYSQHIPVLSTKLEAFSNAEFIQSRGFDRKLTSTREPVVILKRTRVALPW